MEYKERIEQYQEEITLLEKGEQAYLKDLPAKIKKFKNDKIIFDLQLEIRKKKASMKQLDKLMKDGEEKMKRDIKEMNENFNRIMKKAMDVKDQLNPDFKRMVLGIRDCQMKKSWVSEEHKLKHYTTLLQIINNGK